MLLMFDALLFVFGGSTGESDLGHGEFELKSRLTGNYAKTTNLKKNYAKMQIVVNLCGFSKNIGLHKNVFLRFPRSLEGLKAPGGP